MQLLVPALVPLSHFRTHCGPPVTDGPRWIYKDMGWFQVVLGGFYSGGCGGDFRQCMGKLHNWKLFISYKVGPQTTPSICCFSPLSHILEHTVAQQAHSLPTPGLERFVQMNLLLSEDETPFQSTKGRWQSSSLKGEADQESQFQLNVVQKKGIFSSFYSRSQLSVGQERHRQMFPCYPAPPG